ncbi:MAG: dihydrofolate reductase [Epulopiscium sp.]|nr:dihydrofolate reductase [Candidatus Epulonipiscium sp.]
MILIAAVDENWGIGYQGELLARLSKDMNFFRTKTTDNIIIMGRKTLESFPKKTPLPNRINIVLTNNTQYACEGAILCHSIAEVVDTVKQYPDKDCYIVGGGSVYEEFLPYCDTAYITKFASSFPADTYLKNLDASHEWELTHQSETFEEKGISFSFVTYKRVVS